MRSLNKKVRNLDVQTETMISGLKYTPDYLSKRQEQTLLAWIDAQGWLTDLKRRVQHYGYRYDYKLRRISEAEQLGPLPSPLYDLAQALKEQNIFTETPDQVIVNEYLPGQGISAHIDCEPCFGEAIASISLGSDCTMTFQRGDQKLDLRLQQRGLLSLKDDARFLWTHCIPSRKSDVIMGKRIQRSRRVSVTFRTVLLQ